MTARYLIASATVFGLMATLPVGSAFAADSHGSASSSASTQGQSEHFSDKQLKEFVAAQNNVQSTLTKWQNKISSAKSADQKKKLDKEQNKALVKAVKSSGLDPKTYNAIATDASKDPKLTKRIQSYMKPQ